MTAGLNGLDEFLKTAGDLTKGLDQLNKDWQAALPNNISIPEDPNDPFWVTIKKRFVASDERFKAIIDDIGFYIPPKILAYTDPDAEVPNKLGDRLQDLKTRLATAKTNLSDILTKSNISYDLLTSAAVRDLRSAVQSLTPIAEAIGGNYDKNVLDPSKKASLSKELQQRTAESSEAFKKASDSAKSTVTSAMHTDAEIANLRDADILGHPHGIQDAVVSFNADLKTWIDSTNAEVAAQQQTLAGLKTSLETQKETLRIAKKNYEDAVSDAERAKVGETVAWFLCWPVGLALHYTVSKNLIEDVSNQQRIVEQSESHIKQSEIDIQGIQLRLARLQELRGRGDSFTTEVQSLLEDIGKTVDAAAVRRVAAKAVFDKVLGIWEHTKTVQDDAARTDWALSKAQYANAILIALSDASFEKSILVREPARFVLWRLRDTDDEQGTTAGIKSTTLYGGEPLLKELLEIYETDPDTGVRCVMQ